VPVVGNVTPVEPVLVNVTAYAPFKVNDDPFVPRFVILLELLSNPFFDTNR
jgi:hypothetical protein